MGDAPPLVKALLKTVTNKERAKNQEKNNPGYQNQQSGLKPYNATFATRGTQHRQWKPSDWGTYTFFSSSKTSELLVKDNVFVDSAITNKIIRCVPGQSDPFCKSQESSNRGLIPLIRSQNNNRFTQEEGNVRSLMGTLAQYVVESLLAKDMALHGDLTAEQKFKTSIQIASQFDNVSQVTWFGTNLYATIKNSLKKSTQSEDVIKSMKTLTGEFYQQQVYVLPWLARADRNFDVCAIRPDIIVGYAGALHVIELKTHTIYGRKEKKANTLEYKKPYDERSADLKRELNDAWKQAVVQALAVWARVQLLPEPPKVYCHLISTAVEVDIGIKDAYTDAVYAEMTKDNVRRMLAWVCNDYSKTGTTAQLLSDKGVRMDNVYVANLLNGNAEPDPDLKLSTWIFN